MIVIGIDPHTPLLAAWGLPDDASGLRSFALRTLDAVAGVVPAVKPQSAFFERHGAAGVAVLEEVVAAGRERGVRGCFRRCRRVCRPTGGKAD